MGRHPLGIFVFHDNFRFNFWDLLFELEVADVFQTAYQTALLDLTTDAFYPFRKEALEERLKMIEEDFRGRRNFFVNITSLFIKLVALESIGPITPGKRESNFLSGGSWNWRHGTFPNFKTILWKLPA